MDFVAQNTGRRVALTKRRVRWRFGYPNVEAIEDGKCGVEARGEEHEVSLVWSLTSGKKVRGGRGEGGGERPMMEIYHMKFCFMMCDPSMRRLGAMI